MTLRKLQLTTTWFVCLWAAGLTEAQAQPKAPTWMWALDLKVRTGGSEDFNQVRKVGVEVFKDENSGNLIYLCDTGTFAVVPAGNAVPAAQTKAPTWLWGLDLKVRPAGADDFDKARNFGVEVFKDENSGNLVYLCDTGAIAVVTGVAAGPAANPKPPTWMWALDLKVRPAGNDDFDKARKFGFEVFKDENSGQIVYINEKGDLVVRPGGKLAPVAQPKAPTWLWGLDLKARPAGAADFDQARKFGVEVFRDENAGNLIYIDETGAFAIRDAGKIAKPAQPKPPTWLWGLDLKARAAGSDDFAKARKFGIEAFRDDNAPDLVYISESGYLGLAPAK